MTISTTRRKSAYTLIEIMLVITIMVVLGTLSFPAIEGWMTENSLRQEAGRFIDFVQAARLRALQTGEPQTIVIASGRKSENPSKTALVFTPPAGRAWSFDGLRDQKKSQIEIDRRGLVAPVAFRVTDHDHFVQYRFDFLTGHAREESSSF